MQGDIYQLDKIQGHAFHKKHVRFNQQPTAGNKNHHHDQDSRSWLARHQQQLPFVAIYNEDDLSHLLFVQELPFESDQSQLPNLKSTTTTKPTIQLTSYPRSDSTTTTTTATSPCPSDDSETCAIFTDDEDGETNSSFHHPLLHHVIESALYRPRQEWQHFDEASNFVGGGALRHHPAILPTKYSLDAPQQAKIPELSSDSRRELRRSTVSQPEPVAKTDGSPMNWWPAPMDMLEYDWNERFYE